MKMGLANDGGNGAAAKQLRYENPRHRRLPFTAWLFAALVFLQ